jgi:hypothetical protein
MNAEKDTIQTEEIELNSVSCLDRVFLCVHRAACLQSFVTGRSRRAA